MDAYYSIGVYNLNSVPSYFEFARLSVLLLLSRTDFHYFGLVSLFWQLALDIYFDRKTCFPEVSLSWLSGVLLFRLLDCQYFYY